MNAEASVYMQQTQTWPHQFFLSVKLKKNKKKDKAYDAKLMQA